MHSKWTGHPLWLVGFRPFFLFATLSGAVFPVLWVWIFQTPSAPRLFVPPLQWHAHEMFFGFGMAVLGGFLLTAAKNWVNVRGHHGRTLQWLAAAWLFERAALWFGGTWPVFLARGASYAFLVALMILVASTLIQHHATDSYRDNFIFVVALPALVLAKALLLSDTQFLNGMAMSLALFRLAFVVMLERTILPFMKAAFQVSLPRVALLDSLIKGFAALLVIGWALPNTIRGGAALALSLLFGVRLLWWKPHLAIQKLEVGIMYGGGAMLCVQTALEGLTALFDWTWPFALATHSFTVGTMGLIIPAMVLRIAKGHTGRPVTFSIADKIPLWIMLVGAAARLVAPLIWPSLYMRWLWIAAACWTISFGWIAWRITPIVLQPRLDGREH